jgi:dynein heavy chain
MKSAKKSAKSSSASSSRRQLLPPNDNSAEDLELDRAQSQEEYESYLRSPFSFIDKVIENPFTEEFVYLRRISGGSSYDLEIVKHSQIEKSDYYTMSRAGVTHFFKGDTEFTLLDQWEREYFLHTRMMEVDFFKKFRIWKAYVDPFTCI